jgi:hypothetical protein
MKAYFLKFLNLEEKNQSVFKKNKKFSSFKVKLINKISLPNYYFYFFTKLDSKHPKLISSKSTKT